MYFSERNATVLRNIMYVVLFIFIPVVLEMKILYKGDERGRHFGATAQRGFAREISSGVGMKKIALAAFALSITLFAIGCGGDSGGSSAPSRGAPSGLPPAAAGQRGQTLFRLPASDGQAVTVRGPTALFFFTSWCGYCKQVMPEVNRLAEMAQSRGWRVYGIDVNEPPDKAHWFIQNYRPNFPVLLDQNGQVATQYGIRGFPTFVLIDANGNVTYNGHEVPRRF